jgi:hypothetical protein
MGGGLDPIISGVMPKGNSILFAKWEGFFKKLYQA